METKNDPKTKIETTGTRKNRRQEKPTKKTKMKPVKQGLTRTLTL